MREKRQSIKHCDAQLRRCTFGCVLAFEIISTRPPLKQQQQQPRSKNDTIRYSFICMYGWMQAHFEMIGRSTVERKHFEEMSSMERKMKFELKLEFDDVAQFESGIESSSWQIIVQS
ncbi:hypothetical protein Tsp_10333 [Trichinella spiralis]|uniref:hypothetical protein n=1 Tax=Trichinella spiralis TaxID=6334 RepID=UPI0001EFE37E|nr:hypothetical protein Tsp_10333 [Trichinella spiralis]